MEFKHSVVELCWVPSIGYTAIPFKVILYTLTQSINDPLEDGKNRPVYPATGEISGLSHMEEHGSHISCQALSTLVTSGVDVKLLSAPHPVCAASCAREKFLSVERLLGEEFLERRGVGRGEFGCWMQSTWFCWGDFTGLITTTCVLAEQ